MANKTLILQIAASQVSVAGQILRLQDTNNTGRDDLLGNLMLISGDVLMKYSTGDVKGVDANLKVIADGIYTYLGIEVPPSPDEDE